MAEEVRVARRGAVIEITLDRPKVNAIDHATSRLLGAAFAELRDDPELRVGILTAAGERIFSAGWDLKALERGDQQLDNWSEAEAEVPGGFAGITEMWDLNKPVIAALNGLAIGGGFELALACDLVIAAEHVEFALPELPLGLVPDAGAIQRLAKVPSRMSSSTSCMRARTWSSMTLGPLIMSPQAAVSLMKLCIFAMPPSWTQVLWRRNGVLQTVDQPGPRQR